MNPSPPVSARIVMQIDARDDVAVALRALDPGDTLPDGTQVRAAISRGHKIALHDIAPGDVVRKYGWPIGHALADIEASTK